MIKIIKPSTLIAFILLTLLTISCKKDSKETTKASNIEVVDLKQYPKYIAHGFNTGELIEEQSFFLQAMEFIKS